MENRSDCKGKTLLITGAEGFIGKNLAARLRALGCLADSADSREDVDLFLASLSSGIPAPARTSGLPGTEGRP